MGKDENKEVLGEMCEVYIVRRLASCVHIRRYENNHIIYLEVVVPLLTPFCASNEKRTRPLDHDHGAHEDTDEFYVFQRKFTYTSPEIFSSICRESDIYFIITLSSD